LAEGLRELPPAEGLRRRCPRAAELLEEVAGDVLASVPFPEEYRRRLHSASTLVRLHEEVKRRSEVVGIFPDRAALLLLVGMVPSGQDDEWTVAERRYSSRGVHAHAPGAGRR
jgi:putative transposase